MKVYILVQGENDEGCFVLGVYSSMDLAEKQRDRQQLTASCDYYDIEEFEIDAKRNDLYDCLNKV